MGGTAARTVVRPVGYPQLLCLGTILLAAALRLPAQAADFLGSGIGFKIIDSEGGKYVFFGVIAGAVLTICQLAALRSVTSTTGRHAAAVVVAGAETCVGLAILGLGLRIGLFPRIPEDMHPSPGTASFVVIFAGLGFAFLNGLRLLRLLHLRKVEAGAAFSQVR